MFLEEKRQMQLHCIYIIHPGLSGVRVTQCLVLCVCFVDHCLSCCPFSFGHCVVCHYPIYGFLLPL